MEFFYFSFLFVVVCCIPILNRDFLWNSSTKLIKNHILFQWIWATYGFFERKQKLIIGFRINNGNATIHIHWKAIVSILQCHGLNIQICGQLMQFFYSIVCIRNLYKYLSDKFVFESRNEKKLTQWHNLYENLVQFK